MPLTMPSIACVERRVGEDDVRRLAAELERDRDARAGAAALDRLADLGRAGERDLVDAAVRGERRARRAVAGDDVDARRAASRPRRRSRRTAAPRAASVSAGLSTIVLPAASAGAIFQAAISSGKFHGTIAPDDAARVRRPAAARRVGELIGPAGVVEEVRGRHRHVEVARLFDRFAVVERLEHRELARPLGNRARDAVDVRRAPRRAQRLPILVVGRAGRSDRAIDVLRLPVATLRQNARRSRGLMVSNVSPPLDGTNAPPMKWPYDAAMLAGVDSREVAYCRRLEVRFAPFPFRAAAEPASSSIAMPFSLSE